MVRGFSLFELVVFLCITTLISIWSYPVVSDALLRAQATAGINRLAGAVNFTRATAVIKQQTATICPMRADGKCSSAWHNKLTVFLDRNQNGRREADESIVETVASLNDETQVRWRSFGNRQYLRFSARGYTLFQNGNFVVCPEKGNARLARQLIINVQGRARLNHTRNEAGFLIDRSGKQLRC